MAHSDPTGQLAIFVHGGFQAVVPDNTITTGIFAMARYFMQQGVLEGDVIGASPSWDAVEVRESEMLVHPSCWFCACCTAS